VERGEGFFIAVTGASASKLAFKTRDVAVCGGAFQLKKKHGTGRAEKKNERKKEEMKEEEGRRRRRKKKKKKKKKKEE